MVAIKIESMKIQEPMLRYEAKILSKFVNLVGFPKLIWDGVQDEYYCCVMSMCGPDLRKLFNFCDRKMSYKTLLLIGIQCIERLESLHNLGFIHRDLKPDNITIGLGKKASTMYLIDFGLSKRYICPQTGLHVTHHPNKGKFGTTKYMSKNAH